MAHFQRERSDGDWYLGLPVPPAVIRNIDEKTRKTLTGDGGTWAPTSPIVIGGAGVELQCEMALASTATAKPSAGLGDFIFGDDDYFTFDFATARTIFDSAQLSGVNPRFESGRNFQNVLDSGLSSYVPGVQAKRQLSVFRMPLRLADGSLLDLVRVKYRIPTSPTQVPNILIAARVLRVDRTGVVSLYPNQVTPAGAPAFTPDGWQSIATPATAAAYYASGAQQELVIDFAVVGQERVDRTKYDYFVEYREDSGFAAYPNGSIFVGAQSQILLFDHRPY